jgi:hypothetical protein
MYGLCQVCHGCLQARETHDLRVPGGCIVAAIAEGNAIPDAFEYCERFYA